MAVTAVERRHQTSWVSYWTVLAVLDALVPYTTTRSHTRSGLLADEQERLLATLRDMVTHAEH